MEDSQLRHLRTLLWMGVLFLPTIALSELDDDNFPVDSAMRIRVDFWKRVYTEISSHEAFVHDMKDVTIIYEKISYPHRSRRAIRRYVRKKKRAIRSRLLSIYRKKKKNLNAQEQALLDLIKDPPLSRIREMAGDVRRQQGLRNRYLAGLERSYQYIDKIRDVFKEQGLPEGLEYLPHVESSFNYRAYSKVGAAGIWQFMRQTARLYGMKLSYVVDERRDPVRATRAAGRFLRDNYSRLKSWPLALTAYNHGPVSLERAVRKLGTRNMSTIIRQYKGRRFGFASKNFYATFVATAEISQEPEKYFGNIKKMKAPSFSTLKLTKPLTIRHISKATGLSRSTLKNYNLALRPIAFRSNLYLPKDYPLRVPASSTEKLEKYRVAFTGIKDTPKNLRAGGEHIISRGESLYLLSKIYNVRVTDLIVLNRLSNPSRIRPGMKLKIPGSGKEWKKRRAQLVAQAKKEKIKKAEKLMASTEPKAKSQGPRGLLKAMILSAFRDDDGADEVQDFDPSSYEFGTRKIGKNLYRVVVEPEETLGHFADWAGVTASRIRRINYLGRRSSILLGQRLLVPMSEDTLVQFNLKRIEYHQAIEEDLYSNYKITGTTDYIVRRGDTIDELTRKFELPFWLIRKYQGEDFKSRLDVGQTVKIPQTVSLNDN